MDTRERILETAIRLFSGQGYASTSLSQVAKEAQVSKALVLWHFETKEKLFRTVVQRTLEPYVVNALGQHPELSEIEQINRLIDNYYRFVRENLYSVRFVLSLILHEEKHPQDFVGQMRELQHLYCKLLAEILENGRQSGVFRATVDPLLDARLIMSTLHGILVQEFLPTETADDSAILLEHLKATLVEGLRAGSDSTQA